MPFIIWLLWSWPCSYVWEDREPHVCFYGLVAVDNLPPAKRNRETQRKKGLEENSTDSAKRKSIEVKEEGLRLRKEYLNIVTSQGNEQNRIMKLELMLKERDLAITQIESIMRNMERCQSLADSCRDENRRMFYNSQWEECRVEITKLKQKLVILEQKMEIM